MAYDPSIFNISPYYDDFDPNNRFLRVLFKPGYAVQARELTQLQTILQNQISKIGDHLFKNGSRIVAAPITVRNSNFLGFNTGTGTPFSGFDSNDWSSLVGGTVYWGATASGVIKHVLAPEVDDKVFVVLDYVKGYSDLIPSDGTAPNVNGITLGITGADGAAYSPFVPKGATYNGLCKLVTIDDGIFYVDGAFVINNKQSFTPYSSDGVQRNLSGTVGGVTFAGIDKKVGFTITRDAISSSEDTTLLDPSLGSPNYNAPGADRYQIDLALDQVDVASTPDDFIELIRFEDGKVTKKADRIVYGDIAQTLSRRTYDESGSYIVNPFEISIRESSSPENLDVVIGPGKAYVLGVEVETKYPTILGISKGRQSYTDASNFAFNVGNVIGVCLDRSPTGQPGQTAWGFLGNLNAGGSVIKFRNSSNAVIGEAKVHGLIPAGFTQWAGFTNNGTTLGSYVTAGSFFNLYFYGVCAGSTISGAANAVVYGFSGAVAGVTFATLTPRTGTTFGPIGGSASSDTCLVYDITPTQGVSGFTDVVFYGKAVTKSSTLWTPSALASWSGLTGATFAFSAAELDLPVVSSNISLIWSDSITTTPTTNDTLLARYHIVSGNGTTAGLVVSPGNRDEGGIAAATIYKSGEYVKLAVSGFHSGFTAPVKIVAPYKYTVSASDLVNANAVAACSRTKTVTNYSMAGTVTPTLTSINGRIGFTLPNFDVYAVTGIWRNGTSILTDFELDDGQREAFYDHSALVVKKSKEGGTIPGGGSFYYSTGQQPTGISFSYKYLSHGGYSFGPFIGRHAYLGMTYSEIPLFTNPKTGKTVSLANCLDFRHSGPTFDAVVAKPYGMYEGFSVYTGATWSNYLPRIDRISLKVNPSDLSTYFTIDRGDVGDLSPVSPPETENSLTLATVLVPAFTHSAADVVVNKNDVRRYTMADIQSVENRVNEMESFTKLSISEGEMDAVSIKSVLDSYVAMGGVCGSSTSVFQVSTEPVKTSIYTDDFYGHAGGDVADPNHRCSVDYEYGELRSLFLHNPLSLPAVTSAVTTNTAVSPDGLITMAYTTTSFIDNEGYNKTVKVNPTGTVNWLGFIDMSKQYEPLFETAVRPAVYANNMLENDNWIGSNANDSRGFGTQWNDWEYLWSGLQVRNDQNQKDDIQKRILETPHVNSVSLIPTVNSGNERTPVNRSVVPVEKKVGNMLSASRLIGRTKYRTLDNRIVDRTVVPYIPASNPNIGVTAYGLRPNSTGLALYVDGVLVKSGITTNDNGTAGLTFSFSSGGNLSGEKSIRITDNATTQNATQAADAIFYCKGTVNQRMDGVYSTRNPVYRRQTVSSEGIIKDPFNRDVSYDNIQDTVKSNNWTDPLCQTFVVDSKSYPEGVYVSSVTLYFSAKDEYLPVTVQLRPTVNGYPSPSVSFPFSTVTLLPSGVNTGTVGTTATPNGTTFTFSSPVYLEPGEYAIAVLTNSDKYELYASDSGINLTNTGPSNSPFTGTLYQPQTTGAAVQDLSTDIAFSVDICSFSSTSGTANYTSSTFLDIGNCQVVKIAVPTITPVGCTYGITINPNTTGTLSVYNNQNTYLTSVYSGNQYLGFSLNKPNKSYVSPAIDAGVFFGMGAEMLVTSETNPNNTGNPSSSYVSKAVSLPDELSSNGVFATAEVCCPYGSEVRAYVRWSDRGESDLFSKKWTQMTAVDGLGSPRFQFNSAADLSKSEYDFRPTKWAWFGSSSTATVRAYQILLMYTTTLTNASKIYSRLPAVRNLRMASFRSI